MPNRQLEDLERAQAETTRALRLLNGELRRSRDPQNVTGSDRVFGTPSRTPGEAAEVSSTTSASVQTAETSAAAGTDVGGVSFLAPADVATRDALGQTTKAVETLSQSLSRNTQAVENNSRSLAEGIRGVFAGLSGLSSQGGSGLGLLSGGFGLASLGLRIAGLFGRDEEEPANFTQYELPPGLAVEALNTDQILSGFPRVVRGHRGEVRAEPVRPAPTQVVVNVNALDTQSFLDRSSDVAQAVREAMLHMHPLNDVVSEI